MSASAILQSVRSFFTSSTSSASSSSSSSTVSGIPRPSSSRRAARRARSKNHRKQLKSAVESQAKELQEKQEEDEEDKDDNEADELPKIKKEEEEEKADKSAVDKEESEDDIIASIKRQLKLANSQNGLSDSITAPVSSLSSASSSSSTSHDLPASVSAALSNPIYHSFSGVLNRFNENAQREFARSTAQAIGIEQLDEEKDLQQTEEKESEEEQMKRLQEENDYEDEEENGESSSKSRIPLSHRKFKEQTRISIAELKALVNRPDVVELHDTNSNDPRLLIHLKSYHNSVPVPVHWSWKRKYLQNKRGFEKPPFQLPDFIERTGVLAVRSAQLEKEAEKKQKQRARDRMAPKMGRNDVDYGTLHAAFFRFQRKPGMSGHGEIYYEGRENEVKMLHVIPGQLSDKLREALGMRDERSPPPWLFAMQKYGLPPSYSHMKIPGVNAPLPTGARWGMLDGEWGQPPLDTYGQPLYGGTLFGETQQTNEHDDNNDGDRLTHWAEISWQDREEDEDAVGPSQTGVDGAGGGLTSEQEEGKEDVTVMEEEDEDTKDLAGGLASTAEHIQLRKMDGTATPVNPTLSTLSLSAPIEADNRPRQLYQILEEKSTSVGNALFGTSHQYVIPAASNVSASAAPSSSSAAASALASESERRKRERESKLRGAVDIALTAEELEKLDADSLKRKYEEQMQEQKGAMAASAEEEQDTATSSAANDGEVQKKKKRKTGATTNAKLKNFKF